MYYRNKNQGKYFRKLQGLLSITTAVIFGISTPKWEINKNSALVSAIASCRANSYRVASKLASVASAKTKTSDTRTSNPKIDLEKIAMLESGGDPKAYNRRTGARGLYQIIPICLRDFNMAHHNEEYTHDDLFDDKINERIVRWYVDYRIPEMLETKGKKATIENILTCFHAGIKYIEKDLPLPKETRDYIKKYFELINKI